MKFASVFELHPDTDTIFVVGNHPFLEEKHAVNYARTRGGKVEKVSRNDKAAKSKSDASEKAAKEEAAAAEKKAAKEEAAAAEKKAAEAKAAK